MEFVLRKTQSAEYQNEQVRIARKRAPSKREPEAGGAECATAFVFGFDESMRPRPSR
jgi:hypothetical protein